MAPPSGIDLHDLDRALGILTSVLKTGPATRQPAVHEWLVRTGVLTKQPESWEDSPRLEQLPWGAARAKAPPAEPPEGTQGPWPQAPWLTTELYPPVLHLPTEDRREHFRLNAARYLGQIVRLTPGAALRARRGGRLEAIDDRRFIELMTRTSLGQFVTPGLQEHDVRAFCEVLGSSATQGLARIDLSVAPSEHALPGIFVAPIVVLLRSEGADSYTALAIRVGERVIRPGEGPSWELARYFTLQAAQARLVLTAHPRLHFPNDVINAVSRSVLPEPHVLRQLLQPHMEFTLGLHEAVIHHRRSVLHNSQREVYTPFPYTTEGIHALVGAGRMGLPGNDAWPEYRFGTGLFGDHVPYGRFRRDWFEQVLEFVTRITSLIPAGDAHVRSWAEHIHGWVPGFPSGEEIFQEGQLARAVASYVCQVSVYHSGDHHSYAAIPLEQMPWRLRVPPPDRQAPEAPLDLDALVSPEDFFRHQLGHAMFFKPALLRSLRKVRYSFEAAPAREAVTRLLLSMDTLDAQWKGSGFPSSREIAPSLQY